MKKTFSILLASLLLVFTLTACGGDGKDSGADTGGNAAAESNGSGNAGGSGMDNSAGGNGPGGQEDASAPDSGSGGAAGDDALTGDTGTTANDDALTGDTGTGAAAKQSTRMGASYDQMLRNGHVHDTDGKLWDHENATTPGSAY